MMLNVERFETFAFLETSQRMDVVVVAVVR
jgi:hypothetical protein